MGDIVQLTHWRQKKTEAQSKEGTASSSYLLGADDLGMSPIEYERACKDCDFCIDNADYIIEVYEKIELLVDSGFAALEKSPEKLMVERPRPLIAGLSFAHLCERIMHSSEEEWHERAAYFGVLSMEFEDRFDRVLTVLNISHQIA